MYFWAWGSMFSKMPPQGVISDRWLSGIESGQIFSGLYVTVSSKARYKLRLCSGLFCRMFSTEIFHIMLTILSITRGENLSKFLELIEGLIRCLKIISR
jgi:hypothetical protein